MIEVRNLVKMYGNHLAVDHLSFTIEKGKIYGFLGPNGAGKSTTMNIMTGYLGATEGEVLINGHDILKEPEEAKRSIGYLPELPPLYMEMTVSEYLEFAAELKKIPKKEREGQIKSVMGMAKLNDVKDRLIANLSKGYKQRVGLAQAILGYPEIIILDEPTVGLDPTQIIEIRELIRRLSKNHTVILSSHILAEVREICDHIMIIANGKLVASDTTENLENSIGNNGQIMLQARASIEQVKAVIDPMDMPSSWMKKADYRSDGTVTTVQLEVNHENRNHTEENMQYTGKNEMEQRDIREEIFQVFAKANLPLITLYMEKTTLEDIFLELTQGTSFRLKKKRGNKKC